ncbi:putative inorganic phosphate cotransporter [Pseudolycoriella hygida]|uniref:Inorganic phosphate cotransporter n=1 Tax=Pseudolycoriella hygida TaxID=35572 RepID=A0A9Q0N3S1_9DIPT|nr:putative inorganic phosphate cotransporter [Pseudolycoriella hygida]
MFVSTGNDEGHSSRVALNEPFDAYDNIAETNDNEPLILTPSDDGKIPKARQILGLMGFLGFANVYAMRVNLSVAVVAMINETAIPSTVTNESDVCPMPPVTNSTIPRLPLVLDFA